LFLSVLKIDYGAFSGFGQPSPKGSGINPWVDNDRLLTKVCAGSAVATPAAVLCRTLLDARQPKAELCGKNQE